MAKKIKGQNGVLANIAPTVLKLMSIPAPEDMMGQPLV